jgi:hypothetical protein
MAELPKNEVCGEIGLRAIRSRAKDRNREEEQIIIL